MVVRHRRMKSKQKPVLARIKDLEDAIAKGREYLETGAHADWSGFRPWFVTKVRDGEVLPPHKDWVKNVFLPSREEELARAEKSLEMLALASKTGRKTRDG